MLMIEKLIFAEKSKPKLDANGIKLNEPKPNGLIQNGSEKIHAEMHYRQIKKHK